MRRLHQLNWIFSYDFQSNHMLLVQSNFYHRHHGAEFVHYLRKMNFGELVVELPNGSRKFIILSFVLLPLHSNLDRDIETSSKRWKKFVESDCPEKEKFPQEWKNKTALQRLCMMRALRPDRMTYAVASFIEEKLGSKYVENRTMEFAKSFEETSPSTPIFFILSPGVNPLKDVETLGSTMNYTADKGNFHNVSLGIKNNGF